MTFISIYIGKLLIGLLRLSGRSGSALPGLVIEKLHPGLLHKQLGKLSRGVVVVTGTNGKTTTTRALVHILRQSGLKVVTNPTGSNFTRGVYATIARYSGFGGGFNYDVAVFELDEAFSRQFAHLHRPAYVLALNVMRDQLDRYGEIDTTADMIGETVSRATEAVVLNGDDGRVAALAKLAEAPVHYFALAHHLRSEIPSEDEMHSKKPPKKRKTKKNTIVSLLEYKKGNAVYGIGGKRYPVRLSIPGIHNAANIAAALGMAQLVVPEMKPQFMVPTLTEVTSAFGRGETITLDGKKIVLSLVKNPSGFRQALHSFADEQFDTSLFMINDDYADGRDVSWLWDVDFNDVPQKQRIITAGSRAYDMTLRLHYDGHEVAETHDNLDAALSDVINTTDSKAIIYCTYTAMLAIRHKIATGRGSMGDVW